MATRSLSASTSLRMCEERKTACPPAPGLHHALAEHLLHEGVESGRRLVEDQQVGARAERSDEQDLLAIALGVGPDLLGHVELEAVDQLVAVHPIHGALHPAQQVERFASGQPRPEVGLSGDIRKAAMRLGGPSLRIDAIDLGSAARRSRQPEQAPDGGGLACPVGPEVAEHLAVGHLEVERLQRLGAPERLGQSERADRSDHGNLLQAIMFRPRRCR
jgi:hypothetical protein